MKSIAKIEIAPTPMTLDRSTGSTPVGTHASTMELFLDTEDDARLSLAAIIEWDIPGLECTETIGLWFAVDNTLIDYDGVSSLPIEAIEFLRAQGYIVPKEFE